MKNLLKGFLRFLFMFIVPLASIAILTSVIFGYYIESLIVIGLISAAILFIFSGNALIIGALFIASIVVPIVHGDFDLMLLSVASIAMYFASPRLLLLASKDA